MLLGVNLSARANNEKTLPFTTEVTLNGNKLPAGFYEIRWVSHSPEATVTLGQSRPRNGDRDGQMGGARSQVQGRCPRLHAIMLTVRIRCSKYDSRAGSRRLFSVRRTDGRDVSAMRHPSVDMAMRETA